MGNAREEILGRLQNAIHPEPERPDFDTPVYHSIKKPLDIAFKESLEAVNGSVYLCTSVNEVCSELQEILKGYSTNQIFCAEKEIQKLLQENQFSFSEYDGTKYDVEVGITSCEFLIAHTGSVMVSSALEGGRQLSIYPTIHLVIARKEQIVDYLNSAYSRVQKKYGNNFPSHIALITGPSRTADIEKTLVMGAHGPKELHVIVY